MKKEEVEIYKKRLKELGVPEKFIDFPAITGGVLEKIERERLPLKYLDSCVRVYSDRYFKIGDREVGIQKNNVVLIRENPNGGIKRFITINEHGFEDEAYEVFSGDKRRILRRKNGFIEESLYVPGRDWLSPKKYFDTGCIVLIGLGSISPYDNKGNRIPVNVSELIKRFEANKESTLKLYPHLSGYFDELRKELDERISQCCVREGNVSDKNTDKEIDF